jgi:DNA-binding PadR family transcriptional regulator
MHRHRHTQTDDEFAGRRERHRGGPFGREFGGPEFGGRGGREFGGPGFGGPGGRGPRRRRGDVRSALLILLNEGQANGYQLMQTLEERSGGSWRPSPGSVYPALSQLEDEGLIRSVQQDQDSGRTFEITDQGRETVAKRGDQKAPWESDEPYDSNNPQATFWRAFIGTAKAAKQLAQDSDPDALAKATEVLTETRKALYRLLAGDSE